MIYYKLTERFDLWIIGEDNGDINDESPVMIAHVFLISGRLIACWEWERVRGREREKEKREKKWEREREREREEIYVCSANQVVLLLATTWYIKLFVGTRN